MKGIADTGFVVAFANRNDRFHDWAVSVAAGVTEPLLTCEAVLAESAFHLNDVALVLALVRDGLVVSAFRLADELLHVAALADRYADSCAPRPAAVLGTSHTRASSRACSGPRTREQARVLARFVI